MDLKKTRKGLLSAVMAALLVLVMGATTAFAAGTGAITITNAAKGQSYSLYKIFDATVTADNTLAYRVKAGEVKTAAEAADSPFTVSKESDVDGWFNVTPKGATPEKVTAWVKKHFVKGDVVSGITKIDTKTASGRTVEFAGLDFGYYYVTTSNGSAVNLNNAGSQKVEIKDKNTNKPVVPEEGGKDNLKTIVQAHGNDITGHQSNGSAAIGDTVKFKIAFGTTNFEGDKVVTAYTVTDTPKGLKIKQDSVVVKVAGKKINTPGDYTISFDEAGKMTIVIKWANGEGDTAEPIYNQGDKVEITYEAVVTAEKGTNSANVKTNNTTDGGVTDPDNTVETCSLHLIKIDEAKVMLNGAQFKLYKTNADSKTAVKFVKAGDVYTVANDEQIASGKNITDVIDAGKVEVKGLANDYTYYLEEIKAPNGYNKIEGLIEVNMKNGLADSQIVMKDKTHYTSGGLSIENRKGGQMPETGGMGTTILYIAGAALIVCAGVALVARRRASINE